MLFRRFVRLVWSEIQMRASGKTDPEQLLREAQRQVRQQGNDGGTGPAKAGVPVTPSTPPPHRPGRHAWEFPPTE